jgi:uncharacterized protein YndB with AHSA1/START domain
MPTPNPQAESIELRKTIAASREELFAAWLDPQSLRDWMCPGDAMHAEATVDARVGGQFRIVMVGPAAQYDHTGTYLVIDRPSKLSFTWISAATGGRESIVTVEFLDCGGATEIVLKHERLPDADSAAQHTGGWTTILQKLALFMAHSLINRIAPEDSTETDLDI